MLRRLLRERRWIPDHETRTAHEATVRTRLAEERTGPAGDKASGATPEGKGARP